MLKMAQALSNGSKSPIAKYEFKALQGEKHLMIPSTGLALGLEFVHK